MRRAANIDVTQPEAVRQLRVIGATVQTLGQVGDGCPDLLVGFRGCNVLVEMKDGAKVPSHQTLNAAQQKWHSEWAGQVGIANSAEDAVILVINTARGLGLL